MSAPVEVTLTDMIAFASSERWRAIGSHEANRMAESKPEVIAHWARKVALWDAIEQTLLDLQMQRAIDLRKRQGRAA